MKKTKRGQAALEFLMTYGWAILVVLVAIGALAYFGVLNPERLISPKCVLASGSGLICRDFSATAGGIDVNKITLIVRNSVGEKITITDIAIENTNLGADCTPPPGYPNIIINADSESEIWVRCPTTLTDNQKIRGTISIEYYRGTSSLLKKATGELVAVAVAPSA